MNNLQGNDRRKKNFFESERLLLRPLKLSDAWNVYINIRDPEVSRFNIAPPSRYFNNTSIFSTFLQGDKRNMSKITFAYFQKICEAWHRIKRYRKSHRHYYSVTY